MSTSSARRRRCWRASDTTRRSRDVERIAFFSDAVFAIAITLLSIGHTPAVVLHASCVAACSPTMSLLWRTAHRHGLLDPELSQPTIDYYRSRGVVASLPFLVSIPVTFVAPAVAMVVGASVMPLGWLGARRERRLLATHGVAAGGSAPPPPA